MESEAQPVAVTPDPQTLIAARDAAPADVIRQQATSQDYLVLRWAVFGLILATTISLVGSLLLLWAGKTAPDGVVAIGSAGVGALATMLVRPPPPPAGTIVVDRRGG